MSSNGEAPASEPLPARDSRGRNKGSRGSRGSSGRRGSRGKTKKKRFPSLRSRRASKDGADASGSAFGGDSVAASSQLGSSSPAASMDATRATTTTTTTSSSSRSSSGTSSPAPGAPVANATTKQDDNRTAAVHLLERILGTPASSLPPTLSGGRARASSSPAMPSSFSPVTPSLATDAASVLVLGPRSTARDATAFSSPLSVVRTLPGRRTHGSGSGGSGGNGVQRPERDAAVALLTRILGPGASAGPVTPPPPRRLHTAEDADFPDLRVSRPHNYSHDGFDSSSAYASSSEDSEHYWTRYHQQHGHGAQMRSASMPVVGDDTAAGTSTLHRPSLYTMLPGSRGGLGDRSTSDGALGSHASWWRSDAESAAAGHGERSLTSLLESSRNVSNPHAGRDRLVLLTTFILSGKNKRSSLAQMSSFSKKLRAALAADVHKMLQRKPSHRRRKHQYHVPSRTGHAARMSSSAGSTRRDGGGGGGDDSSVSALSVDPQSATDTDDRSGSLSSSVDDRYDSHHHHQPQTPSSASPTSLSSESLPRSMMRSDGILYPTRLQRRRRKQRMSRDSLLPGRPMGMSTANAFDLLDLKLKPRRRSTPTKVPRLVRQRNSLTLRTVRLLQTVSGSSVASGRGAAKSLASLLRTLKPLEALMSCGEPPRRNREDDRGDSDDNVDDSSHGGDDGGDTDASEANDASLPELSLSWPHDVTLAHVMQAVELPRSSPTQFLTSSGEAAMQQLASEPQDVSQMHPSLQACSIGAFIAHLGGDPDTITVAQTLVLFHMRLDPKDTLVSVAQRIVAGMGASVVESLGAADAVGGATMKVSTFAHLLELRADLSCLRATDDPELGCDSSMSYDDSGSTRPGVTTGSCTDQDEEEDEEEEESESYTVTESDSVLRGMEEGDDTDDFDATSTMGSTMDSTSPRRVPNGGSDTSSSPPQSTDAPAKPVTVPKLDSKGASDDSGDTSSARSPTLASLAPKLHLSLSNGSVASSSSVGMRTPRLSDAKVIAPKKQTKVVSSTDIVNVLEVLLLGPSALEFALVVAEVMMSHCVDEDEEKAVLNSIVALYVAYDRIEHLLQIAITSELDKGRRSDGRSSLTHKETLFRAASPSTAFFCEYFFRRASSRYLQHTVGALIRNVELKSKEMQLELDPSKLDEGTDKLMIVVAFDHLISDFLTALMKYIHLCPPSFRRTLAHLRKEVALRYVGMVRPLMATFVFVRFFCPAIVSPVHYGLAKERTPRKLLRALVIISKVLANVASGLMFDGKENYMSLANSIVRERRAFVAQYFDALVDAEALATLPNSSSRRRKATKVGDDELRSAVTCMLQGIVERSEPMREGVNALHRLQVLRGQRSEVKDLVHMLLSRFEGDDEPS